MGGLTLDEDQLAQVIRRQVNAERKAELTDDVLVAAYQQHGSIDKAAAALSELTKQKVSRDKVWRAVQRAGGTAAASRSEDSGSVGRTVASQRRDRSKKSAQYRN